jgi:uncharacterized protein
MSIQSPCVHICEMSQDTGVCVGCNRTLAEIANWSRFSDTQKIRVIVDAQQRPLILKCETSLEDRDE